MSWKTLETNVPLKNQTRSHLDDASRKGKLATALALGKPLASKSRRPASSVAKSRWYDRFCRAYQRALRESRTLRIAWERLSEEERRLFVKKVLRLNAAES